MNCVRWSIGDASFHGMGTSLVPHQDFACHPCPWTKLLPMCPDRTQCPLTSQCTGPGLALPLRPVTANFGPPGPQLQVFQEAVVPSVRADPEPGDLLILQ